MRNNRTLDLITQLAQSKLAPTSKITAPEPTLSHNQSAPHLTLTRNIAGEASQALKGIRQITLYVYVSPTKRGRRE